MAPQGLTAAEAAAKLQQFGPNELNAAKSRNFLSILWAEVREPMVLLLLVCGFVYLSFGDLKESLILLGSVALVISITVIQERKTENALEALRSLSSPRASVIRDGKAVRIPGREVVPGDFLLLEEGDRVPADAVLLSGSELRIDESLLTGESVAVSKAVSERVFASTLVVRGRGMAEVQATGAATEVGKIGRALDSVTGGDSPLRREIRSLVKVLATLATFFCVLTVLWLWIFRGGWREGLLAGLTLAMSLMPEEFPVVLTIFFALGAYRMARRQVLTRRLPAIEALGSATVLCTDKTGTLTENRMRVTHYRLLSGPLQPVGRSLDPAAHELATIAALACPPETFDPVDQAAIAFGEGVATSPSHLKQRRPIREYPLSAEQPMLAEVYDGSAALVALKGAPEAVARACRWSEAQRAELPALMEPLAANGLRIIAVAKAALPAGALPEQLLEIPFEFLGLLGMADPLRPGVGEAIEDCHHAGIQVVMITGDYPKTAAVIARQAGLRELSCMTGQDLETLDEQSLKSRLFSTDVFARFQPLHKLRLVQALREQGAVVAMTGDGVNDAPALKAAHIGIAMGGRGTDVAREASDLVVLDDNFVSIVQAIRLGRRIYSNLRKSLSYLVSVHVAIAGMALVPLIFGWPIFFTPIHIVFLELLIDPACSLVFESEQEEIDIMRQPPRPANSRLLDRATWIESAMEGLALLVITATIYGLDLWRMAGEADARTLGFVTLVLGNLVLILVNRTRSNHFVKAVLTPNRAWIAVTAGALAALAAILYIPFLSSIFKFSALHANDFALFAGAMVAYLILLWLIRFLLGDRGTKH